MEMLKSMFGATFGRSLLGFYLGMEGYNLGYRREVAEWLF